MILNSPLTISDHMFNPHEMHLPFYSQQNMTCNLALLTRDIQNLKRLCVYHVRAVPLEPKIIPLSDNHFLLSNISHVIIT